MAEEGCNAVCKTWQVYCFGKQNAFRVQSGFLSERKGKAIPCTGAEDRKGAGINSGTSCTRKLEAASIRSRAGKHATGGCVKWKTVTKACKVEFIVHTERDREQC